MGREDKKQEMNRVRRKERREEIEALGEQEEGKGREEDDNGQ